MPSAQSPPYLLIILVYSTLITVVSLLFSLSTCFPAIGARVMVGTESPKFFIRRFFLKRWMLRAGELCRRMCPIVQPRPEQDQLLSPVPYPYFFWLQSPFPPSLPFPAQMRLSLFWRVLPKVFRVYHPNIQPNLHRCGLPEEGSGMEGAVGRWCPIKFVENVFGPNFKGHCYEMFREIVMAKFEEEFGRSGSTPSIGNRSPTAAAQNIRLRRQ